MIENVRQLLEEVGLLSPRIPNCLDRPIFVWGVPRSGTTMLYNMLAQHPEVAYPKDANGNGREGTDYWWRSFGEQRGMMSSHLLTSKRIANICTDYNTLLKQEDKARLLDKVIFMIQWIPIVNDIFPTAHHVHIIRDGRAVVNSVLYKLRYSDKEKDRPFQEEQIMYGPIPPELANPLQQPQALRYASQWVYLVKRGRTASHLLGDRYHEIHYEDLAATPREYMCGILKHVQLQADEKFLERFPEKGQDRNSTWQANQPNHSAGWSQKRALTEADMTHLAVMNPLLQSLGYNID